MSNEKIVQANGVKICVESFGSIDDHAVLLIAGAASSMDWWETPFCERLAAGRRFVLRYDIRDTGRSISYEPGAPLYTIRDLAGDAVGVIDAFGLERVHLVGISMGGGIAQLVAVDHPNRVASLTLLSTSPGGPGGPANPDLPLMSPELQAVFAESAPPPNWSDRTAVIEYIVDGARPFSGSLQFDEACVREIAARMVDRTLNIASSMTNHWILEAGGGPLRPRLGAIVAPTLVMHGTADPLFPYGHAIALASEITGAQLLPLEGMGHEMPPRQVWDTVIHAILNQTSDRMRLQ